MVCKRLPSDIAIPKPGSRGFHTCGRRSAVLHTAPKSFNSNIDYFPPGGLQVVATLFRLVAVVELGRLRRAYHEVLARDHRLGGIVIYREDLAEPRTRQHRYIGMCRIGPDRARIGPHRTASNRLGPDRAEPDRTGPNRTESGPDRSESGRIGLVRAGSGPDRAGLRPDRGRIGPQTTTSGRIGPYRAARDGVALKGRAHEIRSPRPVGDS